MPVTLEPGRVHGWDGWWIRRPPLELGLVPQIGGRLMSMRWRGRELSFVHPDHAGRRVPIAGVDPGARKRTLGFIHWGGDKTWIAPQDEWSDELPFLDLDSGEYTIDIARRDPDGAHVTLRSPACRELGVRLSRTVRVPAAGDWFEVEHVLENASPVPVTRGLWDVHQIRGPGIAYVPRRRAGSAFRDGVKAYPAEGHSEGARADIVRLMDGVAAIDCRVPRWFKFGVDAEEGWALGVVETASGLVGYVKEVPVVGGAADGHGCVVEVYDCPHHPYFELEAHGPVTTLPPGAATTLVERRRVLDVAAWPSSEREVRSLVARARG
jgi:hypothetical protein